jgi:galactokinase
MSDLDEFFDGTRYVTAWAPGRVNLLGEHTDYNDGFMLPVATPQGVRVAAALSPDRDFHFHSATLEQSVEFAADATAPEGFGRYIEGCIRLLSARGIPVPVMCVHVASDLPVGTGLSSSAALEVATLRALRSLLGIALDDVALALIAQQAEIRYAGVNCGIMDQMASSLADSEHMLFLDARTLATRLLPMPANSELIVIDSNVPRTLAASKYNERRSECEQAAAALGVRALRDVPAVAALDALPPLLRQRARHVVSENLRVLIAAEDIDAASFGQLMNASHASLRDDYEVSIPELDELAARLRGQPGVYGARLTGAGFGGACVALCEHGRASAIGEDVVQQFNTGGRASRLLVPAPPA